MSIAPSGLRVSFKGLKARGNWLDGVSRGVIRGWSAASVRRLRETLFGYSVPDSVAYGVTLTLPWSDEFCRSDACQPEFLRFVKVFRQRFIRTLPHSALVYRVELQQRGAPHIHAVLWLASVDRSNALPSVDDKLLEMWITSVSDLHGGRLDHFAKYGIKVNPMDGINKQSLFRYLADHASKHKQAQLGWKGRQWGIFQKSNLQPVEISTLAPFRDIHQEAVFWRMIRKLTAYRTKADCPFGYKRVRNSRRLGIIFCPGGAATVRRCYDFASRC